MDESEGVPVAGPHVSARTPATPPVEPALWIDLPSHQAWLEAGVRRVIRFGRTAILPDGGFAYQDSDGRGLPGRTPQLFLTARMAHAGALGQVRGIPGSGPLLDHALASLQGLFADDEHGGWFSDPAHPGARKSAYDHVQVGLAAASAVAAGHLEGPDLLERVIDIVVTHLWSPEEQGVRESFARDWSDSEDYRGANANMHGTEAFLAIGDVTGDHRWHQRALAMAERIVDRGARAHDWLVPEHYDAGWNELLDYHRDDPNHPFRPYGATYGHSLEWARFLLDLHTSPALGAPGWLLEAAGHLAGTALQQGWAADGQDGLPYTVDWSGEPVSRLRLHWPVCEAIQACAALLRVTGDLYWEQWYRRLWDHADAYFVDDRGTWINELDEHLRESGTVWPGRPDFYHCLGAYIGPSVRAGAFLTLAAADRPSRLLAHPRASAGPVDPAG